MSAEEKLQGLKKAELELLELTADLCDDPKTWVQAAYSWGEKDSELEKESLRDWQGEVLEYIGSRLRDKGTRFNPIRIAVASGHGIGKSSLFGMIVNWGLSTCADCKIVYTSNTDTQLRTKTTPEIGKWQRLSLTSAWFKNTATAIYSTDKGREKTWRADAVAWSEHNTEAFAGLHNKGKRIIVIFDEASAIDDKVWEVTEGALTDENTEIIWMAFGNPTRNSGRFKDCFGRYANLWKTWQIDSRTVPGTNKAQLQEWVDTYGEDSDFVKVRVRGMFPSASFKQFISTQDVDKAFGKHLRASEYNWAPKVITVDPAWEGDDELVIGMRQGLAFSILSTILKNDNDVTIANLVARLEDEHKADAVFIDGGYGTGIISIGRTLKRDWQIVWFGEKATDPGYINKRAEMWGDMRKWLKEGGCIPEDPRLHAELTSIETVPRMDGKIQLESKKDLKARGQPSPGRADALALSFAYPVKAKTLQDFPSQQVGKVLVDYDPFG